MKSPKVGCCFLCCRRELDCRVWLPFARDAFLLGFSLALSLPPSSSRRHHYHGCGAHLSLRQHFKSLSQARRLTSLDDAFLARMDNPRGGKWISCLV